MHVLRLLWVHLRVSVLNEVQYRVDFLVHVFQALFDLGTGLAGLALVFSYTDSVGGWGPSELLALLGVYTLVGGAVNVVIAPSMDRLVHAVQWGTLDFMLLKPGDAQLLVSVQQFEVWKLVDVALGFALLGAAMLRMGAALGLQRAASFVIALLAGGVIVYSFLFILATSAFWFVRVINVLWLFRDLYQAGRWPVSVYPPWLRVALTFIVPVAFAVTLPAEALTGRLTWGALLGIVALAAALLALSRWLWKAGLRSYTGASA
jgi:ABC-2 type transport system permease protein